MKCRCDTSSYLGELLHFPVLEDLDTVFKITREDTVFFNKRNHLAVGLVESAGLVGELDIILLHLAQIDSLRVVQQFHGVQVEHIVRSALQAFSNARKVRSGVFDVTFNRSAVHRNRVSEFDVLA